MSAAILISGQLRTFALTWPTIRWHVARRFPGAHYYVTVQRDAQAPALDLLRGHAGEHHVHARLIDDPPLDTLSPPIATLEAAGAYAGYANSAPVRNLLLQHWYQREVFADFCAWRQAHPQAGTFDVVVRLRADLWFQAFDPPRCIGATQCHVPWWGSYGGVNDRFAIMGAAAAEHYFGVYDRLGTLLAAGAPFHPETLVAASLELGQVDVRRTLMAEFGFLRLPSASGHSCTYQAPDYGHHHLAALQAALPPLL
jgi:hypothetical protein